MTNRKKYLSRPKKTKDVGLKSALNSNVDSRTVLIEKMNLIIDVVLSSLNNKYYETEILYHNKKDVVIFQTCPVLKSILFGRKSEVIIVRVFLYDKETLNKMDNFKFKRMKNSSKLLEKHFQTNINKDITHHETVKGIMTSLIALPLSGKHILLNRLSYQRDEYIQYVEREGDALDRGMQMFKELDMTFRLEQIDLITMPTLNIGREFFELTSYVPSQQNKFSVVSSLIHYLKGSYYSKETSTNVSRFLKKVEKYDKRDN